MATTSKAEAKIENEEDPGLNEPGWEMVRRRRRTKTEEGQGTDEVSSEDSDPSVYLMRCAKVSEEEKDRERI